MKAFIFLRQGGFKQKKNGKGPPFFFLLFKYP